MTPARRSQWGGKRPGAGRPALNPGDRHDAAFLVRMLPGEVAALRQLAASEGTTIGVYAREIVRRHLHRGGAARKQSR